MSAPTPEEMREILIDWYVALDIQRYTGDPKIRNGVELRMLDIAKRLYASHQATGDGEG